MRITTCVCVGLLMTCLVGCSASDKHGPSNGASYQPQIDPANFKSSVDHPYFPLVPGTVFRYVERDGGERTEIETTVTSDTKVVMGVTCTVVHDVESRGGRVIEDTYDWYAQDKDGTVWYFGEATREFRRDGSSSTAGSWEAGVNGAMPGIIMPANVKPGEPYRQEYFKGHAEDMGQVVAVSESVTVPAGSYKDCVKTKDWSMLERGTEHKWYARGVGFVRSLSGDEVAELVSISRR
jgi:hypothetical protein